MSLPAFMSGRINQGPWVASHSLDSLKERISRARVVLPICSLGTPAEQLSALAPLVLPPLYHEALDADLTAALVTQIRRCFPFFEGTQERAKYRGEVEVVELPSQSFPPPARSPQVLAFAVDTTVEQHGPHLPLGTDTLQTYAVLHGLAGENRNVTVGPALEYGHLTWGLPFGCSIDLTPPLLLRYARGFIKALVAWMAPASIYVADVHGSLVHRETIQEAMRQCHGVRGAFRWLHEPLAVLAQTWGDFHAGGIETALAARIAPDLVDSRWWPAHVDRLVTGQMTADEAIRLSGDLGQFIARVESSGLNGIVGDVRHASALDGGELLQQLLAVARSDVRDLGA